MDRYRYNLLYDLEREMDELEYRVEYLVTTAFKKKIFDYGSVRVIVQGDKKGGQEVFVIPEKWSWFWNGDKVEFSKLTRLAFQSYTGKKTTTESGVLQFDDLPTLANPYIAIVGGSSPQPGTPITPGNSAKIFSVVLNQTPEVSLTPATPTTTLITSAPKSCNLRVANGPGTY